MGRARRLGALVVLALVSGLPATAMANDQTPVAADAGPEADAEFVLYSTQWADRPLTWGFQSLTTDVTEAQQRSAIAAALDTWARASTLTFTEVVDCDLHPDDVDCTVPDIRIMFDTDANGHAANVDGLPFRDPDTGIVAKGHAWYPPTTDHLGLDGDVHFNDADQWSTTGGFPDLQAIATHELGHALGIRHAAAGDCPPQAAPTRPIMCSVLIGEPHDLGPDDRQAIQTLYGRPAHDVDGTVRRSIDRAAVGNDIVNTSAKGQTSTWNRARGGSAVFYVRVTNDGAEDDEVVLDAPTAPAGFTVRYYVGTTGRVAATGIVPGTFSRPLASGEGVTIRVEVTVKPGAVRNRSQGVAIRATSEADGGRVDVVRAVVHVT